MEKYTVNTDETTVAIEYREEFSSDMDESNVEMEEQHTLVVEGPKPKRTRTKRVSVQHTRRRKAEQSRRTRQQMVNLRDQIYRWREIYRVNNCQHDGDVAKLLIDSYLTHGPAKELKARARSDVSSLTESSLVDCETITEGNKRCKSKQRGQNQKQDPLVNFTSIHGLPINLPFNLTYSSRVLGNTHLESKVYVIVEQATISDRNLKTMKPIMIPLGNGVQEILSHSISKDMFLQTLTLGSMYSCVDISNQTGLTRHEWCNEFTDRFNCGDMQKDGTNVNNRELFTGTSDDKLCIVSDILHHVIDRVVTQCHRQLHGQNGRSKKSVKRKSIMDICDNIRREKLLKFDDRSGVNLPHSSRLRSKRYRLNYAQLDNFDYVFDPDDDVDPYDKGNMGNTDTDYVKIKSEVIEKPGGTGPSLVQHKKNKLKKSKKQAKQSANNGDSNANRVRVFYPEIDKVTEKRRTPTTKRDFTK